MDIDERLIDELITDIENLGEKATPAFKRLWWTLMTMKCKYCMRYGPGICHLHAVKAKEMQ
jgi:hypothetical protein